MRGCCALLWLALLCGPCGSAKAQAQAPEPAPARPRIGLVLSGGGARGGAHIGVLKVLEQLHVPIDLIVGTSSGAIVGAAYASGLPLADIEADMQTMHTATLFRDVSRDELPYRRKASDSINYIGPELGVGFDGLKLPKGAVPGISLEGVLRGLMRRQSSSDFDRLPIPFRAVATDLVSSEMVVLDHGQLALAARASMAVPGAVNPVQVDARMLVDGALTRNLPVDVARRLGAQVVIAVNIGTPLLQRDEITSLVSVSDQVLRIVTEANVARSIQELRPGDVLITPALNGIDATDFDRLREAAHQGAVAASALALQLARYSVDAAAYGEWQAARQRPRSDAARPIAAVQVVGANVVNPEVVLAAMQTRAGAPLDPAQIDSDMRRIYSLGDFESVNYALSDEPGRGQVLSAQVSEKSWGPNYLRFGLTLSTDFEGNSVFNLIASERSTWLNALGAEWRNDLQLGYTNRVVSEWYQPLTAQQALFVAPRIAAVDEPYDSYDPNTNQRLARFRRRSSEVGLDLGLPWTRWGEARLGWVRGRVGFAEDTSLIAADVLGGVNQISGVLARVRVDRLDSLSFPREGYAGDASVLFSQTRFGASRDYTKAAIAGQAATHWGDHVLRAALSAGGNLKDATLPDYELFKLGGFLQLSGYRAGQLLGTDMRFGRLVYNYRLSGPGWLDGMYAGTSFEAGRIGNLGLASASSGLRRAGSVYLALDTPLGPLYLAFGVASGGNRAGYLFLGQP